MGLMQADGDNPDLFESNPDHSNDEDNDDRVPVDNHGSDNGSIEYESGSEDLPVAVRHHIDHKNGLVHEQLDLDAVVNETNTEAYKNDVSKMTIEQLTELLEYYKHFWGIGRTNQTNVTRFVEFIYGGCYAMSEIQKRQATHIHKIVAMNVRMTELDYFKINEDAMADINKITEIIYYTEQVHRSTIRLVMASEPSYDSRMNDDTGLAKFAPFDCTSLNSFQKLLIYMNDYVAARGFRRYKEKYVFEKIHNKQGHFTYAWRNYDTIQHLIMVATQQHLNFEQWLNATSNASNTKKVAEDMSERPDPRFYDLKKDRHIFSFRNSMYIAYQKDDDYDITGGFTHRLYRYGDPNPPPTDLVAAKYFDIDIDDETMEIVRTDGRWEDIQTPNFTHIFETQEFDQEIVRWAYVLLGRMLYDIKELDNWQVVPFFKGRAGTGKSTLLNTFSNAYEKIDVGSLSNNIEKTFGLSQIYGNFMYMAPEIKRDLKWDQAEFQSTASGETVTVNIKGKTAESVTWTTPGMWAGNQLPGWNDNSGSLSRRFMIFEFLKKVQKGDAKLEDKLNYELPKLIIKCNMAYHEAARTLGDKTLLDNVPQYFRDQADSLKIGTNCLKSFMMSDEVEKSPEFSIDEQTFTQTLNDHAMSRGFPKPRWEPDYYRTIFDDEDIHVARGSNGRNVVYGLRLKVFEAPIDGEETTSFN